MFSSAALPSLNNNSYYDKHHHRISNNNYNNENKWNRRHAFDDIKKIDQTMATTSRIPKVRLIPISPPVESKWRKRGDPKQVAEQLRSDLLLTDSEENSDVDEDIVHFYESAELRSKTEQVETRSKKVSETKIMIDSSTNTEKSKESLYIEKINSLQLQISQTSIKRDELEQTITEAKRVLNSSASALNGSFKYFTTIMVIKWMMAEDHAEYKKNLLAAIISLENSIHIIPDTLLHKSLEINLLSHLKHGHHENAKLLILETFRRLPQSWLNYKLHSSFHYSMFLMDFFACIKLIQDGSSLAAHRMMLESLIPQMESSKDELRSLISDKTHRLQKFFNDKFNGIFPAFTDATGNSQEFVTWNWKKAISNLRSDIHDCFYAHYGYFDDSFYPRKYFNYHLLFLATFFVDRTKALQDNLEYHYRCPIPPDFDASLTQSLNYMHLQRLLIQPSPINDIKLSLNNGFVEKHLTSIKAASEPTLSSESTHVSHVTARSMKSSMHTQLISDVATLSGDVDLMDITTISRDKHLLALVLKGSKEINFWIIYRYEGNEKYQIDPFFTHATKRSPGLIRFSPSIGLPNQFLVYSEYNQLVLFNVDTRAIVSRTADLHRNIILSTEFIPTELQDVKMYNGIMLVSLGFDNALKVSVLPIDEYGETRIVDRIHGSSAQIMTAFTIVQTVGVQNNVHLIVTSNNASIKTYKVKYRGALNHSRTIHLESLKHVPSITNIVQNPLHPSMFALTCERDNRVFLVDIETGSLVKQFSARYLTFDKKSDVSFSPCGSMLTCSTTMKPKPPSERSRAVRSFRRSRSVNVLTNDQDHVKSANISIFAWSIDGRISNSNIQLDHLTSRCIWMKLSNGESSIITASDNQLGMCSLSIAQ